MNPDSEPTPGAPVFEARQLTKFYGRARGVEDFSIQIGRGEIFGFLGPNGAGKTTVIRSALGLLRADSGEVRLFGDRVVTYSDRHHERLGYLPADLRLWSGMSARRISELLLGIGPPSGGRAWRDELAAKLELDLDRRVKNLSLGNRQKVGLLMALQHQPELIILDEPTSGLDPLVRRVVMGILNEFAADGGTVIYSSHNLPEVEQICSRVGILRKGKLVALKTIEEIRFEREQRLEFAFREGSAIPEAFPLELNGFKFMKMDSLTWQVAFHGEPGPLLKWLSQFEITELTAPQVSLEEAFLTYYHEDVAVTDKAAHGGSS